MSKSLYDVVDCHVHLNRTEKEGWQSRCLEDRYDAGGSLPQLMRYMEECNIDAAWILNVWPSRGMLEALAGNAPPSEKEQTEARAKDQIRGRLERKNEWLCATAKSNPGRFAPFIGIDPMFGADWMVKELETRFKQGALGVKLIPSWGGFYPTDPAMWPAYKKMEELGLVILAHSGGVDVVSAELEEPDYAYPLQYEKVLTSFPRLKMVLAHLGYGWSLVSYGPDMNRERVELARRCPNAYFDLAYANEEGYGKPQVNLIREIGVERVLWGTDWHSHRSAMSLEGLLESELSTEEKRKLLGENARKLVNIAS